MLTPAPFVSNKKDLPEALLQRRGPLLHIFIYEVFAAKLPVCLLKDIFRTPRHIAIRIHNLVSGLAVFHLRFSFDNLNTDVIFNSGTSYLLMSEVFTHPCTVSPTT